MGKENQKLKKVKNKKGFQKALSIILIAAILVGLIPETVYAPGRSQTIGKKTVKQEKLMGELEDGEALENEDSDKTYVRKHQIPQDVKKPVFHKNAASDKYMQSNQDDSHKKPPFSHVVEAVKTGAGSGDMEPGDVKPKNVEQEDIGPKDIEPEEKDPEGKDPEAEEKDPEEQDPEAEKKDPEAQKEDKPPVAGIKCEKSYYREKSGICTISLEDCSYSPDGNPIESELRVTYDSGRNGRYEEICPDVIHSNTTYSIQTDRPGNYKARLTVKEQTENALCDEKEICFEVLNKAPSISGNALLEKKVTIMSITDKIPENAPDVEEAVKKLTEEGYDVTFRSFFYKNKQAAALGERHYAKEEADSARVMEGEGSQEDISVSSNGLILSSQVSEGENETVSLSWKSSEGIRSLAGYRLFRKLGEEAYTSISTWDGESHIKILNVYPNRQQLYLWMNKPLKDSKDSAGKGLLDIEAVSFDRFNEEPERYLLDDDKNYKYDVIMFGTADCNWGKDLNELSYNATLKFIQSGRGVLFGHDSVVQNAAQRHPWLARFGELMGMSFNSHGALDGGGNKVDIVKEGTLTSYPWKLTGTLDVPFSHSSGQYVDKEFGKNTTIWMRYQGKATDGNYYLLSKNSLAMIQTGHSGDSNDNEKKVLANTLCYLKQYTIDDHTKDPTAYDMEAPEVTNADAYFTSTDFDKMALRIEGRDKGTIYRYFVQTVPKEEYSQIITSNEVKEEMKTGIKGFAVLVNEDSSPVPELCEKSLLTGEIKNFVKAVDEQAYVDIPSQYIGKECYAHICAVDNSDNVSEQITVKLDTTSNIYDLQQFFQEEADYIVLDLDRKEWDLSQWANIEKALVETGAEVLPASEQVTDKILTGEEAKRLAKNNHIFPGQKLSLETYYSDAESDPCQKQEITVSNEGSTEKIIISGEEASEKAERIYTVSENGTYHITVKAQDDPSSGNEKLSDYRAWSEPYTLADGIVCSERPVLKDLAIRESEEAAGTFQIAYDAYVPGKEALEKKGISKVSLSWRKVGDSDWNHGELPRKPDIGCVYLLKAVATDEYGIDSLPKAALLDAQTWSLSEADSSLKVQNSVEILTLGGTEETCKAQLEEVKKSCASEKCPVSVRINTDNSISFQETESIKFLILPDREYEKTLLDDPVIEKALIQSNAVVIYADGTEPLADTLKKNIDLLKRDVYTGMFCGMSVDYAGKYAEFSENGNYAVRLVVEYENALTGKPQTNTYQQPFTPERPGTYNMYFQVATKYKNGNIGRYQGEYPIVSNFHVYKRPVCKTVTFLSYDRKNVSRINAVTHMEKKVFGRANYIEKITQQWKQVGGQWRSGELPSVLTRGETYLLKTIVTDADGISSCPYVEIISTDDVPVPDVTAPKVSIESPSSGAKIAGPVDIIGSIYDDTRIAEYSISYDNGSGKKGTMTYTDTENKSSQKLGAIDFSDLPNGAYTITVTAKDEWDNQAKASVRIINEYPLVKLTNVTADEEYVYVHGKINQINEVTETAYAYKNPGEDNEIPITGNEEAQEKGKYIGLTKVLEILEPEDNGYFDGNIMSEEEILFRIPLDQMESGIYTFHARAKDKSGISTAAAIKAELIKKSTEEDETITEETSSIVLQFNSVELVDADEGSTAEAGKQVEAVNQSTAGEQVGTVNQSTAGKQAEAANQDTAGEQFATANQLGTQSAGTVSDNGAERPEAPAAEDSDGEIPAVQKETCVRIYGTYESTDEITEKIFELKNTETNAPIPFELQMENGRVILTAKASQMGQGDFVATGRLKNSYGCEAYAAMGFRLSGGEGKNDITVEETPGQNQGAFPSISAILFNEDRTLVRIHGDRAGHEHTSLTCEHAATGKKVNVKECDDNGIIGTMYSSDFESGQYKVTLTAYDSNGAVLGMASMLFTYTKGGQGGSVSDNTVSDNTVSGNSTDKTAPVIEMEIEDEDYILTEAANLTGSIYDETALKEYRVTLVPEGEESKKVIKTGTEEIKDAAIAAIDPTTLANGKYRVVVEAEDEAGNRKTASLGFTVDSRLKIGNMNIGFTDLVAKLPFGSLNLQRFYNSNNKTCGDFGYGWTMGLTGMTLRENSDISRGYEQVVSGMGLSTSYHIRQTANHDVTVHYGDGTSDRFRLTLSPDTSGLVPIRLVQVGFTCQTSQRVTLELAGDNSAGLEGGMLIWEDESKFDQIVYILTMKDRTKVYLTADKGVFKIEDSLGNIITVDENGYHGEGNKGITLTRNEEGLVTSATDESGRTVSYGYDENKDLTSFTNEAGNTVRFTYDEEHNLASITDPMGVAAARNEYDETGRLTATIDAEGNRMEYTYDVEGRTQAIQDRRGNTTVHTYDENGNILKTVDPMGTATYNTYDSYGNLLTETDGNGNTTSYTYDDSGNITTVTDAEGNTTTSRYNTRNQITGMENSDDARLLLAYNERGQLSQTTDNGGNRTDYAYTSAGKLASISDAIGTVTAYTYDEEGNVTKTRDGNGNETAYLYNQAGKCEKAITTRTTAEGVVQSETSYVYDASGNVIQTQDGEGRITKTEYDPCGRICRSIDAEGRATTYTHTPAGELSAIHYDDGTSESFTYDEEGNILSSTDRLGNTVRHAYDKAGNLIRTTDALGNETTYEYDRAYHLTKVERPTGAWTEYQYDSLGRNTEIRSSDGSAICYSYDGAGNLTSMTDALGNTTKYEYDSLGNRCSIILPDGSGIKTAYDPRGRITSQTDAEGNKTTYQYDNNNNLTRVTDAHNQKTEYTYNEAGELTCIKDANDNCTYYEYNKNGELTKTTRADGRSQTYEYDQYGRLSCTTTYGGETITHEYTGHLLTKKTAGEEVTTYEYDGLERLISVCNKEGEIKYEYDTFGRVSARTTATGEKLTYGYDAYGRLDRITTSAGTTEYTYDAFDRLTGVTTADGTTAYTYDKNGNKASQSNPNGTTLSYEYDSCNRLTKETVKNGEGEVLASYRYTYNKNGQKTTATEEAGGSWTESEYTYDALNRLTKETTRITGREGGNRTERTAYTYDAVGNRTEKLQDGDIYQYEYNNLNQLTKEVTPAGEINYQYDAEGSLTFRGSGNRGETYTYSADGKLLSCENNTGGTVTKETYTYDGEGNRLTKEETAGNASRKTYYVTDNRTGYSQTVLELDGGKKVQAAYERGDSLLTVRTKEGTKTYITDGHGDVRYLTDEEGHVTDSYRYSAYGELTEKSGNTNNPYLYCGEYYDEGTGLYYLRARYMRPSTGTFLSMDSYQGNAYDPASLHKYTYAQNNPQMYNDPSGHFIATVQMCINSVCNSYLRNYHALNVIGMISGVMNATVNQLLGGEDDPMTAYIKGYMAGLGFGAVYYGACAITAIFEVTALAHLGMFAYLSAISINELTFALCAGAVGNNKAALVHTVLAVLSIGGAIWELGLSGVISVTGPKGTVEVDIKGKANKSGNSSVIHNDVLDSPRTGSALKVDDVSPIYEINEKTGRPQIVKEFPASAQAHGFNDIIDNYAGYATKTSLNNATLYQLDGSLNGVSGRFEWIIQDGQVTHRMFIQNGTMNGVPIKP